MIYEYSCLRCGECFIGDGEDYEEHAVKSDGTECGGNGKLMGIYRDADTIL